MEINLSLLKNHIEQGNITKRKHPKHDLWIYNYTAKTQYEKLWDEITLICRGLVLDNNYNIIARGFKKFFNLEEIEDLPNEPFTISEKYDGSLGLVFLYNKELIFATRGSFESSQAKKLEEIYLSNYRDFILEEDKTYLFEIIYPENKIIVDYNNLETIIFLAEIDNKTGKEKFANPLDLEFPWKYVANSFKDYLSPEELKLINSPNKEGFVLTYKNGLKVKVKFEDYIKIHRIKYQLTDNMLIEYLVNENIEELYKQLANVPDELNREVQSKIDLFIAEYKYIETTCSYIKKFTISIYKTRKEQALFILNNFKKYSHIIFLMLDNKIYSQAIWKKIKDNLKISTVEEIEA